MKYCPLCRSDLQHRRIDGASRLACSAAGCGFVHWKNPTPVVAGLVRWEGHYVLARNASWPPGMFSLVTGFLESGETPEAAAMREVEEELGLHAAQAHFVGHFAREESNQLIIAFAVDAHGTLAPNHEIAEVRALTPGELKAYDFGWLQLSCDVVSRWLRMSGG